MLVLESLPATDPKDGIDIANKYSAQYSNFQSLKDLNDIIDAYLKSSSDPGEFVVVHISAHGNARGIFAHSGGQDELITWEELRDTLRRAHIKCGGKLFVGISTCEGANIIRLLGQMHPCPYSHFAGPTKKISFADAASSFFRVYDSLNSNNRQEEWKQIQDDYKSCHFAILSASESFERATAYYLKVECTPMRLKQRRQQVEVDLMMVMKKRLSRAQIAELDKMMQIDYHKKLLAKWRSIFNT